MGIFRRKDSPFWWYWLEGTSITRSTKIPHAGVTPQKTKEQKAAAVDIYNAQMGDLARGTFRLPPMTKARRLDDHLDWYLENVSPHKRGHERELGLAKPLREFFATKLLHEIDRAAVAEYCTQRLKTHRTVYLQQGRRRLLEATIAASTVNREVTLLKSVVKSAIPKYISSTPIDHMPRVKEPAVRRRTMKPHEEKKLLAVLAPDDRALVLMALDGLVRLSDCLDVRRADVRGHEIEIADPKGGTSYRVPMSKRLAAALKAVPIDSRDRDHFFARRRRAETAVDRRTAIRQMLQRACEKARLPYGRAVGGITFHWATRRTGLSRMLQSNEVSLATAQKIGNWKRADVVLQVYAETIGKDERAAVEVVGRGARKRA